MSGGPTLLEASRRLAATTGSTDLRIGYFSDYDTLNPIITASAEELHSLVYDKLMTYDAQLKPALSLAKSRHVSADGKTITFVLHDGATFHDGTPLTSADVKFSYELVQKSGLGYSSPYVTNLTAVHTPDKSTVVTTFSKPVADDPALLMFILPKHIWEKIPKAKLATYPNSNMIGSGPFQFVAWAHNQSIQLKRNPTYWGPHPGMQSISWLVYQNPETMALALQKGEIQLTWPLSASIFTSLQNRANIAAVSYLPTQFVHFGFNLLDSPKSKGNPLLRDRVLRQAMAHAIDREKLVALVLEGHGSPGTTIIMPAFKEWHLNLPKSQQFLYDPARARQMLDQAGYTLRNGSSIRQSRDGRPLHFRVFASLGLSSQPAAAQLIVPMMADVGIQFDLTVMSDSTLGSRVFSEIDYDSYVWSWISPPTPTFMLAVETKAAFGVFSDSYYNNPMYDKLVALQAAELDFKRRQQLVYQAQKMFHDDVGYVVLFYTDVLEAHRTDTITGWENVPGGVAGNWSSAGELALRPV